MVRWTQRRSFRALTWATALFVAFHASLPWWLPGMVERQRTLYFARLDRLEGRMQEQAQDESRPWQARRPLVLMLGTSRTICGFDGRTAEATARRSWGERCAQPTSARRRAASSTS